MFHEHRVKLNTQAHCNKTAPSELSSTHYDMR